MIISMLIILLYKGTDFELIEANVTFDSETTNVTVPFAVYNNSINLVPKHFYLSFVHRMSSEVRINILNSN